MSNHDPAMGGHARAGVFSPFAWLYNAAHALGRRWTSRALGAATRAWTERNAAWRAIAPAWPVAFGVFACAGAMLATDQGREVVLVTATVDAFSLNEGPNREQLRFLIFLGALGITALSMMMTAILLMTIRRRTNEDTALELTDAGQRRVSEDPVHASILLRTNTAYALGIALPLTVYVVFTYASPHAALGLPILPNIPGVELATLAATFVIYRLLGVGQSLMARAVDASQRGHLRAQQKHRAARDELLRRAKGIPDSLDRRTRDELDFLAGNLNPATASNGALATARSGAEFARSAYYLINRAASMSHWLLTNPMRVVIAAAIGLVLLAQLIADGASGDYIALKDLAAIVVGIAVIVSLTFMNLRRSAMRAVDAEDRRHLVVDRRVQAVFRGVGALAIAVALALFWIGYHRPTLLDAVGPGAAAMAGLFVIVNVLAWFVRSALGPPPYDPPPRYLWRRIRWDEEDQALARRIVAMLAVLVGGVWNLALEALYQIGRLAERLQGVLTPGRVLAAGLLFLALDKVTLPFLERNDDSAREMTVAWTLPVTVVIVFGIAAVIVRLYRGPPITSQATPLKESLRAAFAGCEDRSRETRRARHALRRAFYNVLAPRGAHAVRIPSYILLAPFLFASLGEDNEVPRVRIEAAQTQRVDERADAWLARAAGRLPDETAPIPAIVVLAEGGGIRAASHAGQMLAALDRMERGADAGERVFLDNLYAISGVSGGSIGAAAYIAERAERNLSARDGAGPAGDGRRVSNFLNRDLLTPLIAGLVASDFVAMFVPVHLWDRLERALAPRVALAQSEPLGFVLRDWPSRSDFFERAMANFWNEHARSRDLFERPIEAVVEDAFGPTAPIVMFNTFSADDGLLATTSNVQFAKCPRAGVADGGAQLVSVQTCLHGDGARDPSSVPFSTAAHLSARFPLSNPPGLATMAMGEYGGGDWRGWRQRRFVDGGYIDNSGAAAAAAAVRELQRAAHKRDANNPACAQRAATCLSQRLRVIVLHFYARAAADEPPPALSQSGSANEVTAPVSAFIQARARSGGLPVDALCRMVAANTQAAQEQCDRLADLRRSNDASCDGAPVPIDTLASRSSYGLNWIVAPLCITHTPQGEDSFLLGWLMSERAHAQVCRRMEAIAGSVRAAIRNSVHGGGAAIDPAGAAPGAGQACDASPAQARAAPAPIRAATLQ